MKTRVLLIFLDGIGLGPDEPGRNPFSAPGMPALEGLLGGKAVATHEVDSPQLLFKGIDACLGVPGVPQSATGQTTLFTGINAAEYLGYHYPAFPDEKLKGLIDKQCLLKQVVNYGLEATFANAYTPRYFELARAGKRTHSVTTLSVYAAALPFRGLAELKRGEAVYWDLTNAYLQNSLPGEELPVIGAAQAGENLARLSRAYALTLFECFQADLIGHKRDWGRARAFLRELDEFCAAVFEHTPPQTQVIITSDHGNFEDLEKGGHTTNPALLLVKGDQAAHFACIRSLVDVTGRIMQLLERDR